MGLLTSVRQYWWPPYESVDPSSRSARPTPPLSEASSSNPTRGWLVPASRTAAAVPLAPCCPICTLHRHDALRLTGRLGAGPGPRSHRRGQLPPLMPAPDSQSRSSVHVPVKDQGTHLATVGAPGEAQLGLADPGGPSTRKDRNEVSRRRLEVSVGVGVLVHGEHVRHRHAMAGV